MNERIYVIGGPLDGTDAEIPPTCSRMGFFIHTDGEDDDPEAVWYGYFDHHERTDDGRRIFRPGKP